MNLYEALSSLPAERLREIAAFYGLTVPGESQDALPEPKGSDLPGAPHVRRGTRTAGQSSSELAMEIARHLLVPANLIVVLKGLDDEELTAARLITLSRNGAGVVMEQCHQRLNQISRKWRRNGARVVEGLIKRGLVFIEKQGYRQAYYVPEDLRSLLATWFLEKLYAEAVQPDPPGGPRRFSDPNACLRHVVLFLSYVRKNKCKLTQNGTLFKKTQQEMQLFLGQDETADDALIPVRYPPRLAFIVFFAKSRALVKEEGGMMVLGAKAVEWVSQDVRVLRKDLFDYWMQTFLSHDADLTTLFWIMVRSPEGSWLSLEKLLQQMEHLTLSHTPGAFNLRAERNLVGDLEYLGILDVSRSFGGTSVRVTPLGRALVGFGPWPEENFEDNIYVEPNFEVMVPSGVHPAVLWDIDFVADLVRADQMMIFKLSRTSVYRAVQHGISPASVVRFLQAHSRSPLPQNVAYSIAHWARAYGRVELIDALIIKCDSPELADELSVSRKLQPYVIERLGPLCLRIDRRARAEVSRALVDEGYMPKLPEQAGASLEVPVFGERERPGDGQEPALFPGLSVYGDDTTQGETQPQNGKKTRQEPRFS
ncbi:MAG: helicase-associated domain-containing protein [Firmicutes bacterium]|nr:helicase-associated domain-containing protein [Candidatus Fermentithermobacillaceae bacterium]